MKRYKNYIFDLYATLVDIHTDQTKQPLWEYMSMIYSRYGAIYSWEQMRSEYFQLVKEEMDLLKNELHTDDPEADIEYVFCVCIMKRQEKILEITVQTHQHGQG